MGRGGYRRRFDPTKYLIVGLDQRGCGKSTPWAIDDLEHLDANNTQSLLADIEALRVHLRVEAWLLHGVSWGSTLALAYALAHRDRVTEIVLTAVTTGGRAEIDWITEGVGAILTSLLVTHHLEELPATTTHAMLVSNGTVAAAGDVYATLTTPNVSDAFAHPIEVSHHDGRWSARTGRRVTERHPHALHLRAPSRSGRDRT